MHETEFPRYNDLPPRLLILSLDQTVLLASCIMLGALTEQLLGSIIVGSLLAWSIGKWRDSRPDGYLLHIASWYGLIPAKGRSAINPFLRLILPV